MATTKKTTKKPVAKKAPAKSSAKTTVRRVRKTSQSNTSMRSFVPSAAEPFFTFRISHQTLYWLVLAAIVLALGVWVVNINDKVQRIYDEIDATNSLINTMPDPTSVKKTQ